MRGSLGIISLILRLGVFGTFIGHGTYALLQREDWINFITFWGIKEWFAIKVMIGIGIVDYIVAIITLIKPNKNVLIWAVFWAFSTAVMRVIIGMSLLEFIERASNWATPLALLYLLKEGDKKGL